MIEQGEAPDAADRGKGGRRWPAQSRSRERMERILAVATRLIAEKGSDGVAMSAIAAAAEMSIGALYQYFADKAAIIRTLAERYNGESRDCIATALSGADSRDRLLAAFGDLIDQYHQIMLAEPAMRDIWSGMQADKQLAALQRAESRAAGRLLADALHRVRPGLDPAEIDALAFLIWELGEAAMRLAIAEPPRQGAVLVARFKAMASRELAHLLDRGRAG